MSIISKIKELIKLAKEDRPPLKEKYIQEIDGIRYQINIDTSLDKKYTALDKKYTASVWYIDIPNDVAYGYGNSDLSREDAINSALYYLKKALFKIADGDGLQGEEEYLASKLEELAEIQRSISTAQESVNIEKANKELVLKFLEKSPAIIRYE